jgi:hypothetical protein
MTFALKTTTFYYTKLINYKVHAKCKFCSLINLAVGGITVNAACAFHIKYDQGVISAIHICLIIISPQQYARSVLMLSVTLYVFLLLTTKQAQVGFISLRTVLTTNATQEYQNVVFFPLCLNVVAYVLSCVVVRTQ